VMVERAEKLLRGAADIAGRYSLTAQRIADRAGRLIAHMRARDARRASLTQEDSDAGVSRSIATP